MRVNGASRAQKALERGRNGAESFRERRFSWRGEVRDLEEHIRKSGSLGQVTGTKQGHEPAGKGWLKAGVMGNHKRTLKITHIGDLSAGLQKAAKSTGR